MSQLTNIAGMEKKPRKIREKRLAHRRFRAIIYAEVDYIFCEIKKL